MPKKSRKVRAEKTEVSAKKFPKRNASAVAKGAAHAVLGGRPSKQAVTAVFGKTGYVLSWIAKADCLGVTPEELCDRFKTDANKVKKLWAELTVKNEKTAAAN
jgi:DNA polymerase/3'-5' exonuclease PolX